jgi:hypothetical protein
MAVAKLNRAGNEVGANTTYQIFLDKEGVPAVRAFHIEDHYCPVNFRIRTVGYQS